MKRHVPFAPYLLVLLLMLPNSVAADYTCSFDLQLGVATSKDTIRVLKKGRTVIQVNRASQLFVDGRLQKLSSEQNQLLYDYANYLHIVVPEVTLIAKEGVGLVTDNITRIYSGLVGQNSDSTQQLYSSMKKVKSRVKEKFGHTGNYFFINPGKLESPNDNIPNSLQQQIESGFSNVSGILTAVGTFDTQGESDESDDTSELRKRARMTCKKLYALNKAETALHEEVAAMRQYDIVINRREK